MSSVVGTPEHLATADAVTDRTTTLVKNDDDTLPLAVAGKKVLVTGYGVGVTSTLAGAFDAKGATTTVKQTGHRADRRADRRRRRCRRGQRRGGRHRR